MNKRTFFRGTDISRSPHTFKNKQVCYYKLFVLTSSKLGNTLDQSRCSTKGTAMALEPPRTEDRLGVEPSLERRVAVHATSRSATSVEGAEGSTGGRGTGHHGEWLEADASTRAGVNLRPELCQAVSGQSSTQNTVLGRGIFW